MEVTFDNEFDAFKLAEQLYGVIQEGKKLIFELVDPRAIKLAVELAGIIEIPKELRRGFPMPPRDWDEDRPAVWIACLAAYNNGKLHGGWINVDRDVDEIQEDIDYIMSYSPEFNAEEWAIHASQGFHGVEIGEYENIEDLSKLAEALTEHGEAFAAYRRYCCDATVEDFESKYVGCYESEEDFVYEQLKEAGTIEQIEAAGLPDYYIDLEKMAHDWFCSDFFSVRECCETYYVFRNT